MAAPSMTYNAKGNIANAVALAAGASNGYPGDTNTYAIDASTKFEVQITVEFVTGATVATPGGLIVRIFTGSDTGPSYESNADIPVPTLSWQSPQPTTGAARTYRKTFFLPTGKYVVRVTNVDATNALTSFSITTTTVDTIA